MNLYHGDCLEILPTFPPASVEAIITDLPYGTTACEWDSIIPLAPMWEQVKRVLKANGVFVTTASQPFTSALIMSNPKWFRYEWIWFKNKGSNFLSVEYRPLKEHENILVFSPNSHLYNPQYEIRSEVGIQRMKYKMDSNRGTDPITGQKTTAKPRKEMGDKKMPGSIQFFICEMGEHPTQKPVKLYEYLIRTYTNAGDTVLDFCMGSGTTLIAAKQTGRNGIGIEKDKGYFEIASRRIAQAPQPLFTELPRQPTLPAPDGGESAPSQSLSTPDMFSAIEHEPTPAPRR